MNRRGMGADTVLYILLALAGLIMVIALVWKGVIGPGTGQLPGEDTAFETAPVIVGLLFASRRGKHHNF